MGMMTVEWPFWHIFKNRFTNRKHREFEVLIFVSPDAQFELREFTVPCNVPTLILIEGLTTGFVSAEGHIPLFPPVLYKASGLIRAWVKLAPGVNLGRKRPLVTLEFRGVKLFREP
jgi:hypothetical protein